VASRRGHQTTTFGFDVCRAVKSRSTKYMRA
jgi:hypothetical protein